MSLLHESKLSLKLAFPLVIGQLSQMLLGVVDTLMVGQLGVTELAALTFANSLFYIPFVFGIGLLTSISVATSNAHGANDPTAARGSCRHGLYLGTALGLVLFLLALIISYNLHWFGQPEKVTAETGNFYRILMLSNIPALVSIALKNHADALNRPWPPFWIYLGGVVLNIFLNWILIFGKLGCPELGFEGAAWATLIARTLMLAGIMIWLIGDKDLKEWVPRRWFRQPKLSYTKSLLGIGFPASIQMLCEVSAFSIAGLMMGHISANAMAAHQITVSLTGTAFMIPLGLSMALTVRVGQVNGAKDYARLKTVTISGWLLVGLVGLINAACFFSFGHHMSSWFTDNHELIELTATLLAICAVFQIFDGLQVGSASMLRGLHDTRVPAVMGFVAYWIIGIPLGLWLAFFKDLGAAGVWWGLASGLIVASITLGPRLWNKLGKADKLTS